MEITPKKTNETDSQTAERIKQHEEVAMQPKDKYSYFYVTLGILIWANAGVGPICYLNGSFSVFYFQWDNPGSYK